VQVTGNLEEIGWLKMEALGIRQFFSVPNFGGLVTSPGLVRHLNSLVHLTPMWGTLLRIVHTDQEKKRVVTKAFP